METTSCEVELYDGNYEVFFDFDYTPAYTPRFSGTSRAEGPDEEETYEIYNEQIECVGGHFRDLNDDEVEYVHDALLEQAKSIVTDAIESQYGE